MLGDIVSIVWIEFVIVVEAEMKRLTARMSRRATRGFAAAATISAAVFSARPVLATITIDTHGNSTSSWTISNGALTLDFNPGASHVDSVIIAGHSDNILDPAKSLFDEEFAGTPFGAGTQTFSYQQTANYIDFWTSNASTGTSTNPITYAFHYVMFNNDPAVQTYEVLTHSATDPATSVGQGQFLLRVDPAKFSTLYQVNTSPNNMGATTSQLPNTTALLSELNGNPTGYGDTVTVTNSMTHATSTFNPRLDLAEVLDLNGDTNIESQLGRNFLNKYDYSSYEQFRAGATEVGPNYAVSTVVTSQESFTGGPTKQNLQFTNNILMQEFLSGHYGSGSVNPGDPGYSYVPTQGVNTTKLFGPYTFRITNVNGETPAQLYNDATNSASSYIPEFDQETTLIANGYVPRTARGSLQANISSSAGWSSNIDNNTIVLADNGVNFQESHQGFQYWQQIDTNGQATFTNVVPGTYRASIYQYGQWGETRYDGVQVTNGRIDTPQSLQFVPENFGTTIFTLGTPDRSSHEFLNGHFTSGPYAGQDDRNYYGSYNYWQEMADLGNNGKVVYYGTAVPGHAATNDSNKWINNQWQTFDPNLYNPSNNLNANSTGGTVGLYPSIAPAYVGNPATYQGSPWEIHFATTAAQATGKNYVILSIGIAGAEGSLIVGLNGNTDIWHYTNNSDPMIRSGLAGYYEWTAMEWPIADLAAAGSDNVLTFSVSTTDGVMYDAMRLELSAAGANPSVTGWHDYFYVNSGGNNAANADDSIGQAAQNVNTILPEAWAQSGGGTWTAAADWNNFHIPDGIGGTATFGTAASGPFNITLDANHTVSAVVFSTTNAYNISAGNLSTNTLILDANGSTATITNTSGNNTISAPMQLNSDTSVMVAGSASTLTLNGSVSGAGGVILSGAGTLVLGASNSYAGQTTINSGVMTVIANGALPGGGAVTNNSRLNINAVEQIGALTGTGFLHVGAVGTLSIAPSSPTSTQNTLSVSAGGLLNLNNNSLTLNYGTIGSPNATVAGYISSAYNVGGTLWSGTTGITSNNAAADPGHHSIAFADGADGIVTNLPAGISSAIPGGGALPAGSELITYAFAGDANLDGKVDFNDFVAISTHFLSNDVNWDHGNFNYDGVVDFNDFVILSTNFGEGVTGGNGVGARPDQLAQFNSMAASYGLSGSQIAAWDATISTLPEPTGAGLLTAGVIGLLQRRRRRMQRFIPE
jgi:autotransporter-associated beta strand protein